MAVRPPYRYGWAGSQRFRTGRDAAPRPPGCLGHGRPQGTETSAIQAGSGTQPGGAGGQSGVAAGSGPASATAASASAQNAAAATAAPPFSETLVTAGRPLARRASLASATPAKPTGRPMTSDGCTFLAMISCSAAGSQPTTQIAPGPAWPKASRTAAAGLLMAAVRASRAVSISSLLLTTG